MILKTPIIILVVVATISAMVPVAVAGDLNPPVGPVAPTHKTLTEVEPRIAVNETNTPHGQASLFKITQPGSYYLTGNITGVLGKHGIEIAASGVTLDLNGFDLLGVASSLDGVNVNLLNLTNIAVVNGSVRSWGDEGVDLGLSENNCRVVDMLASGNTGNGIVVDDGCTVSNCAAYLNAGNGISVGDGCTITNCSTTNNTGSGINAGGLGCAVSNCSAFLNSGSGITTSFGSVVSSCSTYQNSVNGISVGPNCLVADCIARGNTLDGIMCSSASLIRGNTCAFNGGASGAGDGAGIHATGGDNRIEGNNCTGADRGIDVDAAGNFITRNTCSGNTVNWDVAASNKCLVVLGVNAAAINGDSGGATPGSTDPNANFTY